MRCLVLTRRLAAAVLLPALIGALVLGTALARADALQQGTPNPGSGISTEVLGRLVTAQAPGQEVHLLRVTFAPGSSVTAHFHPGATIYHLASGTLGFALLEGEAHLVRAGMGAFAATPTAAELISVGAEITLAAGDTAYFDGSTVMSERNDGTEPAVVLVSNLRGADEPARQFVDGTPVS